MTAMLRASICSVEPSANTVRLTLDRGDVFLVSLKAYPRLVSATSEQLARYELVDDRCGVIWPELSRPTPWGTMSAWDLLWDRRCNQALDRLKEAKYVEETLGDDDRDVVALWRMEADIHNGGFLQFFGNWADPTYLRAKAALASLGASRTHEILKQLRAVLDRLDALPERVELSAIPRLLTPLESAELQRLDEAFWKAPDRLSKLATSRFCDRAP